MTMRKGGGEGEGGDDHEKGLGRGGGREGMTMMERVVTTSRDGDQNV